MAGRSLIELMIALTISLVILVAISAFYLTTQRSNRLQEGLRSADDGARWAMGIIGDQVRLAGLGRVDLSLLAARPVTFNSFNVAPVTGCEGGFADTATGACAPSSATAPDAVTIRYLNVDGSKSTATDCNNRQIPQGTAANAYADRRQLAENAFYVSGSTLWCRGSDNVAMNLSRSEALLANVQDFQVSYGLAQDADSVDTTTFVSASAMVAADWSRVVNVRVCLLVFDPKPSSADVALNYTDCSGQTRAIADGMVRRRFVSSFALRNRVG